MSQKIASASASGSTIGFFIANSAGSTGRQSSMPAAALDPPTRVAVRTNTPRAVIRIKREFRGSERGDFIAKAFRSSCVDRSQESCGTRPFGNRRLKRFLSRFAWTCREQARELPQITQITQIGTKTNFVTKRNHQRQGAAPVPKKSSLGEFSLLRLLCFFVAISFLCNRRNLRMFQVFFLQLFVKTSRIVKAVFVLA